MAARLNPRHQDMVREKIRSSQIVKALEHHALGENGIDMSETQVQAARILLDKCVPNLNATEHSGPDGGSIPLKTIVELVTK